MTMPDSPVDQSDTSGTVNTGRLIVYERCSCCVYCETFVDEVVRCLSCGEQCSCEGCVADQPDPREKA